MTFEDAFYKKNNELPFLSILPPPQGQTLAHKAYVKTCSFRLCSCMPAFFLFLSCVCVAFISVAEWLARRTR